jgi:cytochrome c oxidase assembly factor CtaG
VNILGLEITTASGKTNWPFFRAVLYCLLATWAVGVRWWGVDPFDDFMAETVTLSTWIDLLVLVGVYLLMWHVMYPNRPRVGA